MRLYTDLAKWWPLLSAPEDYAEEAVFFREHLPKAAPRGGAPSLLELGSGGGNLASHLAPHFRLTLSDIAPAMLAVSRALNHGVEHVEGDMRSLRLGRLFDAVLIHDAVMYAATPHDVRAALATAAAHCRPGGTVVVAPDCVRETFRAGTETGGHDGPDGRSLRYLEWSREPEPDACAFEVLYAVVLTEPGGKVRLEVDRHVEGVFPRADWLAWFAEAGIPARAVADQWGRDVFVGTRPG